MTETTIDPNNQYHFKKTPCTSCGQGIPITWEAYPDQHCSVARREDGCNQICGLCNKNMLMVKTGRYLYKSDKGGSFYCSVCTIGKMGGTTKTFELWLKTERNEEPGILVSDQFVVGESETYMDIKNRIRRELYLDKRIEKMPPIDKCWLGRYLPGNDEDTKHVTGLRGNFKTEKTVIGDIGYWTKPSFKGFIFCAYPWPHTFMNVKDRESGFI